MLMMLVGRSLGARISVRRRVHTRRYHRIVSTVGDYACVCTSDSAATADADA